jgi:hypothetical protein
VNLPTHARVAGPGPLLIPCQWEFRANASQMSLYWENCPVSGDSAGPMVRVRERERERERERTHKHTCATAYGQ